MKKFRAPIAIAAVIAVAVFAVVAALLPGEEEDDFRAVSEVDVPVAAPDAAQIAARPKANAPLPLPDPRLAEEKKWKLDGPPPEGFGSNFVQHEKVLHGLFRRQLGDAIELCLDEMRRRGENYEGRLVFHVSAVPAKNVNMAFRLNGVRTENSEELPTDVYQCIWDTVEAVEVKMPVMAISIFPREGQPDLFVPYDVRAESPAGPVEVEESFDAGAAPGAEEPVEEEPIAPDAGAKPVDLGA